MELGQFKHQTYFRIARKLKIAQCSQSYSKRKKYKKLPKSCRDRDARGKKIVSDNVAGVKGPAKTICRQIILKSHF